MMTETDLKELIKRSNESCELCAATSTAVLKIDLVIYEVPDSPNNIKDTSILICNTCSEQLNDKARVDVNHWRALNESMWSPVPAVQVVVYRMLEYLRPHGWPADLLEMMYLEDDTIKWAEDGIKRGPVIIHKDVNGNALQKGDNIVLIKDLDVKGTSFIAKRGTPVRNITLVHDNENQIEGKVNGTQIVILTQFVKKIINDR
jgi:protein PhnA